MAMAEVFPVVKTWSLNRALTETSPWQLCGFHWLMKTGRQLQGREKKKVSFLPFWNVNIEDVYIYIFIKGYLQYVKVNCSMMCNYLCNPC